MTRQMSAERTRRAAITEAQGQKQAAITVAEGQGGGHPGRRGRAAGRHPEGRGPGPGAPRRSWVVGQGLDANTMQLQYLDTSSRWACRPSTKIVVPMELNLPYYFSSIDNLFGRDGAWGYWTRRWTAEEGRHSIVLRDYLIMSGHINPVDLERARMAQVTGGVSPHPGSIADTFVYLALQELATRIAHHNTGKALPDAEGYGVMKRVAADENLHYLFYRDLVSAALEIDPSGMMEPSNVRC
jgi:hypothetical protein